MAKRIKEKAIARREAKDKRPRATAMYVRISSRKVKLVIDLIRGKKVGAAISILMNLNHGAADPVLKLLKSAIANAENNLEMNPDNLFIAEVYANQGPTMKRIKERAMGRAARIRKRSSHITVVLDQLRA